MPNFRTTLQYIQPPSHARYLPPHADVLVDWSQPGAPLSLLLDFAYGIAVLKRWATDDVRPILKESYERTYSCLQPPPCPLPLDADSGGTGHFHAPQRQSTESDMDATLRFSMIFNGCISPEMSLAEMWEKREEEAERYARQAGQTKVQRWLAGQIQE